jgi:ribosome-binding factor A
LSNHKTKRGARAPRAHDACVDPDLYFSDHNDSPSHQRKTDQLRVAIRRALTQALDCDVDDPRLEGLHVHDVLAEPGGTFAALFTSSSSTELAVVQARLRDAAPLFRTALANGLARKRIPQVTLFVIPDISDVREHSEVDDA